MDGKHQPPRLERLALRSRLVVQKSPHTHWCRIVPVLKRRRAWFDGQLNLNPAKVVFIDETGLSTRMARLRGVHHAANAAGPACLKAIGKMTTFTGGLRLTGMTAPFV